MVPAVARKNEEVNLDAVMLLARRRSRLPRMLRIRGKPGNNPQGKVNFPLGLSRLSWARSLQTFVNPSAASGSYLIYPNGVISLIGMQGMKSLAAGLGARSPQRILFFRDAIVT